MTRPLIAPFGTLPVSMDADAVFAEPLRLLRRDVQALFGPSIWLDPVEVRERPYSYIMRLAVCPPGSTVADTHLFLKVSKPPLGGGSAQEMRIRVETDFLTTARVFETMSHGVDYGAVRPIACYPEHLAIVTEAAPGETLLDKLNRQARWTSRVTVVGELVQNMAAAGRWVRAFQAGGESAPPIRNDSMRSYVDHRLVKIAAATGRDGQSLRASVLTCIDSLCNRMPAETPATAVHGDLSPVNILVSAGRLVVIDLAMTRLGHPLQDVARLFAQVELLSVKPQFRRSILRHLQEALLQGFDSSLTAEDPGFRLQVLAQRVNHLASLTIRRYSWLERTYNGFVRRQHWRWLEAEAEAAGSGGRSTRWV